MTTQYYYYKLYDISHPATFYIGSTKNPSKRKYRHKKNTTNRRGKLYKCKLYEYIRSVGGWDNIKFEIIGSGLATKDEARLREQQYIDELKPVLNTNRSYSDIHYLPPDCGKIELS